VYQISPMDQLRRFLILGSSGEARATARALVTHSTSSYGTGPHASLPAAALTPAPSSRCPPLAANNYYVGAKDVELSNAGVVVDLLAEDRGRELLAELLAVSLEGRAPKQVGRPAT
jgi:hypothetical protein